MERPLLRLVVLALPALLGLASLAALLVAPFSWGAGDDAELSPWMPPATALVFGLPFLLLATWCLVKIREKTRAGFDVSTGLMFYGLLAMPVAIVAIATIALRVADPATYDNLTGSNSEPNLSPDAYMISTVIVAGLLTALLAAAMANYIGAIAEIRASPHDRVEGEVDGVGELLNRRN